MRLKSVWVIFPILGYVPIFYGLWVTRTVGCIIQEFPIRLIL